MFRCHVSLIFIFSFPRMGSLKTHYILGSGTKAQIITLIAFATNSHQKFFLKGYLNISFIVRSSTSVLHITTSK